MYNSFEGEYSSFYSNRDGYYSLSISGSTGAIGIDMATGAYIWGVATGMGPGWYKLIFSATCLLKSNLLLYKASNWPCLVNYSLFYSRRGFIYLSISEFY